MASSSPRWRTRRVLRPWARTMASASFVDRRSSQSSTGHTDDARRDAGKILGAAGLLTLRSVGVQRQADHHLGDALALSHLGQRVQHRRQSARSIEHTQWTGEQSQLVADRHTHPPLAGVDAEHSTLAHRRLTWDPGR